MADESRESTEASDSRNPQQGIPIRKVGHAVLPANHQVAPKAAHTSRRVGHAVLPPGKQSANAKQANTTRRPGHAVLPTQQKPG